MRPISPAALIRGYERGAVTEHEAVICLIESAAFKPPSEFADVIPAEFVAQIRALTDAPPDSPDQAPRTWAGSTTTKETITARQKLWFDGAWQWHAYFRAASD